MLRSLCEAKESDSGQCAAGVGTAKYSVEMCCIGQRNLGLFLVNVLK